MASYPDIQPTMAEQATYLAIREDIASHYAQVGTVGMLSADRETKLRRINFSCGYVDNNDGLVLLELAKIAVVEYPGSEPQWPSLEQPTVDQISAVTEKDWRRTLRIIPKLIVEAVAEAGSYVPGSILMPGSKLPKSSPPPKEAQP